MVIPSVAPLRLIHQMCSFFTTAIMTELIPLSTNVLNLENHRRILDVIVPVGSALSTCSLALHLYARHKEKALRWDSLVISLGCILSIAMHLVVLMVNPVAVKLGVAALLLQLSNGCAEMYLLLLYRRISPQGKVTVAVRPVLLAIGIVIVANLITIGLSMLYLVSSVRLSEGTWLGTRTLFLITSVVNIATDVLLVVMAIPTLMNLHTKWKRLIIYLCLTLMPAAVRVSLLPIVHYRPDLVWWAVPSLCIEGALNVVCVCLPAMCQSFKHVKQTASRISRPVLYSGQSSQTSLRPQVIYLGLIPTESNTSNPCFEKKVEVVDT
nr:uncharacterized protein CTRU02_05432 [Colletotrichum truncatum]KAF6793875.1 hypothetical protein CTRU02_05432 [Colletotrichum truncatum]